MASRSKARVRPSSRRCRNPYVTNRLSQKPEAKINADIAGVIVHFRRGIR
jgi:hypothetical protein